MGFFKAISRLVINSTSDTLAKSQKKKNKSIAYNMTKEQIKKAKHKGQFLDWKKTYFKNKNRLDRKTDKRNETRKIFFSDLID